MAQQGFTIDNGNPLLVVQTLLILDMNILGQVEITAVEGQRVQRGFVLVTGHPDHALTTMKACYPGDEGELETLRGGAREHFFR